jgi:hypothetical protein
MAGPRAVSELLEVWLRGLPLHESGILRALALAIAQAKGVAAELPPSIDRRCRDLIGTKLDEAEHWALAALRAAVDRADRQREQLAMRDGDRFPPAPIPPPDP